MMNKVLLAFALCLTPLFVNAEDQSFENFIDAQLVVSDISMTEDGMVITYEGNVGKYGLVHATHNMTSTNEESTKGYFTGTVQAINDAGELEKSATLGLWSRKRTHVKSHDKLLKPCTNPSIDVFSSVIFVRGHKNLSSKIKRARPP